MKKVEEPLSTKVENPNKIQIVKGKKRKRYWGKIVVFPPPFKKMYVIQKLHFPSKKREFSILKENEVDQCYRHLLKKQTLADDDFHVQLNTVYLCSIMKHPWNDVPHVQGLGFSGASAKMLRVSG